MKNHFTLTAPPPQQLEKLLSRWREVPLYSNSLARGDISASDFGGEFYRLPFITKREMREGFPDNFLRAGQRLETLLENQVVEMEHTSGTSEEQTPVLFRHGWWNEQEERALRLNATVARVLDAFPGIRRATLTTPTCNGSACYTNWMSRLERTFDRTLFVNLARIPFLLKDAELARMAEEIAAWSPQFLDTDPAHAAWFALYCERRGLRFPSLKFILTSYEFTSVVHRKIIERVFRVPVYNLYGSTETGHLLMEDEHGQLRPSTETAFLEVVAPDEAGVGDLVVTTLSNDFMPLVRYRIGDLVERRDHAAGPTYIVHGRARDALRRADGRRVTTHEVDQCFDGVTGIAHYQLHQKKDDERNLDFIPEGDGPDPRTLKDLACRLEHLLQHPGALAMQSVPTLLPAQSGKFRLTYHA